MIIRILLAILVLCFPSLAVAQEPNIERGVPASREQVQLSFAPLVKKVSPAVVNIYTKRTVSQRAKHPFMDDPFFGQLFGNDGFGGRMRRQVESALGSGVIVQPDGLVVTNAHVIKGAEEITVVLTDGREFDARVALSDEPSDLALLRVDTKGAQLPFASLKPSESLEVGDLVLAIGNPFGVGQTVTSGIVSALAQSSLDISDFNFFIQTDAAINPGNSGGPLVALDGGVVGINSAIYSRTGGSLGIGFAIPSEMVATVLAAEKMGREKGIVGGKNGVVRPWLGVTAQRVTADIASSLGLAKPGGALIAKLHSASPLKKAGLDVGDVVLSFNGKVIRDPSEMKFRMATVPLGQSAKLEAVRKGKKGTYEVKAMAPPDEPARQETKLEGAHPLNGATIANLNPAVAVDLGLGLEEEGVVVLKAPQRSYVGSVVDAGDLLLEINGRKISAVGDVKKALEKPSQNGWSLVIRSNGRLRRVLVR
ncbi:MAG: serine protease [Micavibrio sp.]|nr:MAG: serine protease [Micavibrio sp.]